MKPFKYPEGKFYLLGPGACTIYLHEANRMMLRMYLEGEEVHMLTDRGSIPCSTIRNRIGLLGLLEAKEAPLFLLNGFH